jgi:hypothetical protein
MTKNCSRISLGFSGELFIPSFSRIECRYKIVTWMLTSVFLEITWLYLTLVWTFITFGKIVNTNCMIYRQVTILYRHSILEKDGINSSPENPKLIREQFFVISPDTQHDRSFTQYCQKQISANVTTYMYGRMDGWLFTTRIRSKRDDLLPIFPENFPSKQFDESFYSLRLSCN